MTEPTPVGYAGRVNVLLTGETDGGTIAVLLAEATWETVASAADSLQAAATKPITWRAREVAAGHVNEALIEAGRGDAIPAPPPILVPAA